MSNYTFFFCCSTPDGVLKSAPVIQPTEDIPTEQLHEALVKLDALNAQIAPNIVSGVKFFISICKNDKYGYEVTSRLNRVLVLSGNTRLPMWNEIQVAEMSREEYDALDVLDRYRLLDKLKVDYTLLDYK